MQLRKNYFGMTKVRPIPETHLHGVTNYNDGVTALNGFNYLMTLKIYIITLNVSVLSLKLNYHLKYLKNMGETIKERKRTLSNEADARFQTHDKRKTLHEKR